MEACRLTAMDLACRRGERLLFAGLSLDCAPGQALQVAGPNGMGKSSLIRILAGLARPYAGNVERHGAVGLLDERPALEEHQPLGEALAFWSRLDGHACALDRLGLDDLADVPVRYLSTGRAQIWLLDEPLNGLDREAVTMCEALVAEHCANGGIALIASHQMFTLPGLATLPLADFVP